MPDLARASTAGRSPSKSFRPPLAPTCCGGAALPGARCRLGRGYMQVGRCSASTPALCSGRTAYIAGMAAAAHPRPVLRPLRRRRPAHPRAHWRSGALPTRGVPSELRVRQPALLPLASVESLSASPQDGGRGCAAGPGALRPFPALTGRGGSLRRARRVPPRRGPDGGGRALVSVCTDPVLALALPPSAQAALLSSREPCSSHGPYPDRRRGSCFPWFPLPLPARLGKPKRNLLPALMPWFAVPLSLARSPPGPSGLSTASLSIASARGRLC